VVPCGQAATDHLGDTVVGTHDDTTDRGIPGSISRMAGGVDVEDKPQAPSRTGSAGLAGRPPRWLFHILLAAAALPLLWADSVPGSMLELELLGWFLWFCFAVTWFVRLVVFVVVRRRLSWWFLVAPLMLVVLVSLLVLHVPLKARWAGSHDAFDAALARVPIGPGNMSDRMDETIGSYRVVGWRQFSTSATSSSDASARYGVAFIEEHPGRSSWDSKDEAGFAYLPEGPGERFMWTAALGAGWYAWREDRVAMGG
jgi:hypothetical protein